MSQINQIPDISYHLIFCFLRLKELPLIARCCKEWKRLVTLPSFLNMFRHDGVLHFENPFKKPFTKLSFSSSTFTYLIHKIHQIDSIDANLLIYFNRLKTLHITIKWEYDSSYDDITPVFKTLAPRLLELNIRMHKWYTFNDPPPSFYHFQDALSLFTSLISLTFIIDDCEKIFTNISFLSKMQKLKSFSCGNIYNGPKKDIYQHLSSLPNLKYLNLDFLISIDLINILTELCAKSEEFTSLKHLGYFNKITDHQQCAQLLNKFPHLETIDLKLYCGLNNYEIPTSLGKWIRKLDFFVAKLDERDVDTIISLPHLKSLTLHTSSDCSKLKGLIRGLSLSLEHLYLNYSGYNYICSISFEDLSVCTKLKTLSLIQMDIRGSVDLLLICKQLESLTISYCDTVQCTMSSKIQEDLKIPSIAFPMLKKSILNFKIK